MHLTNLCPKLTKLVFLSGIFVFSISGYSMDGAMTGGMATAPAGGGSGGIAIELWFVLMLALLGAAQWLDQKDAKVAGHHGPPAHKGVDRWSSGR